MSGKTSGEEPEPRVREAAGRTVDPRDWSSELGQIYDWAPIGLCLIDADLRFVRINERLAAINGTSVAEHIGKTVGEVLPNLAPRLERLYGGVIDSGEAVLELEIRGSTPANPDEERVWLVSHYPVKSDSGRVVAVSTIVQDITDRKRAEQELRKVNRALRTLGKCNRILLDARDELIFLQETCRTIVDVAGYRLAWIGLAEPGDEENVRPVAQAGSGDSHLDTWIITWADAEPAREPAEMAIRTGRPSVCHDIRANPAFAPLKPEALRLGYASSVALPLIADDQRLGVLSIYAVEPDAFDQEELRLLANLADDLAFGIVTLRAREQQRHSEDALRESEEKYRRLIEAANDAIFVADENGVILEANKRAAELLGIPTSQIVGMHQTELHPKEEADRYNRLFREALATGGITTGDLCIVDREGRRVPVEVSANEMEIGGRRVIQGIFRDVTEAKKTAARLRQSEKMEAIGTLVSGIAHDFNNLLSPIIGYTELMMEGMQEGLRGREDLAEVLAAANRAKELVRQILTYTRRGEQERRTLLVQPVVKEALNLLRASLPATIEIRQRIDAECGPVLADPTQIHQVIMNLGTNALHAMQNTRGVFEVTLTEREFDATAAMSEPWAVGRYLQLTVSDTGHGMNARTLDRIFEPYFTTKAKGKGTGMGLSVVEGIMRSHDGHITVESDPGRGSTFHLYLPLLDRDLAASQVGQSRGVPKGSERILLVDDDESVLRLTRRMLERHGYRVTSFDGSLEALEAFELQPDDFDLVVADQTMPGLTGADLAQRLVAIRRDIPVVLCSGLLGFGETDEAEIEGVREFFPKPITSELGTLIRRVLDARETD